MPNWCDNTMTLRGPRDQIKKLADAFAEGKFCNAVLPIPEDLYITAGFLGDTDKQAELERKTAENKEKHGYGNWYDFCCDRWGTKWDIGSEDDLCDVAYDGDDAVMTASFESAWAPPCGVYAELEEQGIAVQAYYWEPGCAFAGRWEDGEEETYEVTSIKDAQRLPADIENAFGIVEQLEEWEEDE